MLINCIFGLIVRKRPLPRLFDIVGEHGSPGYRSFSPAAGIPSTISARRYLTQNLRFLQASVRLFRNVPANVFIRRCNGTHCRIEPTGINRVCGRSPVKTMEKTLFSPADSSRILSRTAAILNALRRNLAIDHMESITVLFG